MKKYKFDFEIKRNAKYCCYRQVISEGKNIREALANARIAIKEYVFEQWHGGYAKLNYSFGKCDGSIGIH